MPIRNSVESDNTQLKSIFKYSLECSESYAAWYFNRCKPYTTSKVVELGNTIASVIEQTPYSMMINNTPTQVGYISNITTLPEYRGNGYAKDLLIKTISEMYNQGKSLCFAVPPSHKMFDKFGFRLTHQYKQYNIELKNIPQYSVCGSVERVSTSENVITILSNIYEYYTSDKNGYIIRAPQNWFLILEDLQNNFGGHVALVKNADGVPIGYIMYLMNNREMHIYEMAYIDHSAYTSIMAYIRSHITQVDRVTIKVPKEDLSYLDFCDNRTPVCLYPFVTARIINVLSALTSCISANNFSDTVTLQVIDTIEERNNGVFRIENGSVNMIAEVSENIDIMCDIGTLTQLYLGYLSPIEAKKMNLLIGDISKITKLFKKTENFINMLIV